MKTVILLAWCASTLLQYVTAYPSGAPSSACNDLNPSGHPTNQATGTAPYTITVTKPNNDPVTQYAAGETLKGIVKPVL